MNKVMIIAEAGVNHNGDLHIAKSLVDAASETGADAIKFQTFQAKKLAVSDAKKADYQKQYTQNTISQYEMLKELELSKEDFLALYHYCGQKNIQFMSTPFDEDSIEFLDCLGLNIFKIPSGEITNYSYLKKIDSLNKPIIMSTGMATIDEIADALKVLKHSSQNLILLHCTSAYPTPMKEVNLKAMCTLKQRFQKEVGYSDHTLGLEAAIAATALGACVIEKHFTLDQSMPGPDHKISLEPKEFKQMADAIRNIEQALGDGVKRPTESELKNKEFVRKSLVAAKKIKKGEPFTYDNLCAKRCGMGISPMKLTDLLGNEAVRDYEKDERIEE
ncbi:N-acetylneuraminate synthase [Lachnotalea glycerini]|uniref:N-acetylneuraminate synthase n=1 Tax=Lachnotalea glycerini TaxID=1763509 RepID=A0A371JGP0_9FIRM|nr:N-acetylneuraminate synthase [Lachnotalea glycerini]RDY31888.1 N-acetylneuraminate synthase [Lachnotalea glycerini]